MLFGNASNSKHRDGITVVQIKGVKYKENHGVKRLLYSELTNGGCSENVGKVVDSTCSIHTFIQELMSWESIFFITTRFFVEALVAVLLELPFSVVQRANLARLQPARDAMKVKGMIADAPSDGALFRGI